MIFELVFQPVIVIFFSFQFSSRFLLWNQTSFGLKNDVLYIFLSWAHSYAALLLFSVFFLHIIISPIDRAYFTKVLSLCSIYELNSPCFPSQLFFFFLSNFEFVPFFFHPLHVIFSIFFFSLFASNIGSLFSRSISVLRELFHHRSSLPPMNISFFPFPPRFFFLRCFDIGRMPYFLFWVFTFFNLNWTFVFLFFSRYVSTVVLLFVAIGKNQHTSISPATNDHHHSFHYYYYYFMLVLTNSFFFFFKLA